jgi:hypothetical protein
VLALLGCNSLSELGPQFLKITDPDLVEGLEVIGPH